MKRSLSTVTVLVTAVLFASGLVAVQPVASASANETRESVQAKLAAHLARRRGLPAIPVGCRWRPRRIGP